MLNKLKNAIKSKIANTKFGQRMSYAQKSQNALIGLCHSTLPKITSIEVEGNTINVYLSNSHVGIMGAYPDEPNAVYIRGYFNFGSTIYVNNGFLKLDERHQKAIIMHEVGHHVNGDVTYTLKDQLQAIFKGSCDMELKADAYSQSMGCDMVGALEALIEFSKGRKLMQRELKARIKHLKSSIN